MKILNKILLLISIVYCTEIFAQEENKINFTVGALYQNDMQYLGRKDSITIPLYIPNIRLELKNGIFADAEIYLDTKSGNLNGGYIAAGYKFEKNNFGGSIDASKYFFKDESSIIKSDIKFSLDASLYYNFGFATFNLEPTYNIGTEGDFIIGTGFTKDIDIDDVGENGSLEISPKLYTYLGTENFTVFHKKKTGASNTSPKSKTVDKSVFQIMDLEANLPISYTYNDKIKLTAEPQLIFPFNYKHLGDYYSKSSYPNPIFIFKIGASYTF